MKLVVAIVVTMLVTAVQAQKPEYTAAELVLSEQYGNRMDPKLKCRRYQSQETRREYCMQVIDARRIDTPDGPRLYVLADGSEIVDGKLGVAGHVAPGMIGAFALRMNATGAGRYIASSKELYFGTFGYSGAKGARFVLLGPAHYYGWMFTSGGTWQGRTATSHQILAPRDKEFTDLSDIPSLLMADQAHRFTVTVQQGEKDQKVFPLVVEKRKVAIDKQPEIVVARFRVPFNFQEWKYELYKSSDWITYQRQQERIQ